MQNNPTQQKPILTDLDHLGIIRISGEDAATFLQNQFSNDVRKVDATHTQLNSYSSPKGRMFAIFRLFKFENDFYMRMPAGLIEPVSKRLRMFVLMSKVKLEDSSAQLQRFGIAGPGVAGLLAKHLRDVPVEIDTASEQNGITLIRVPGEERFELYGHAKKLNPLIATLTPGITQGDENAWPLLDILNGLPNVYPETSEHFIPQMTNLQQINGLSFKKGCYPGQEIVARMQYLGKLKRRMYRLIFTSDALPPPGTGIVSIENGKAHEAGEIVDARRNGDHNTALAVLQSSSIQQELQLNDNNGAVLQVAELPYAIEES
jgi:hypothetical protein